MMDNLFERPALIEEIRNEIRGVAAPKNKTIKTPAIPDPETVADLFHIHSLNQWMTMEKESDHPKCFSTNFG
jgi:hypothetical protein